MFSVNENREGVMNHHQQQHLQQPVNPFSNSGPFFYSGHFDDLGALDAPMHQIMMESGAPSMGYSPLDHVSNDRVLNVPYDVGLCENFQRIHVGDHRCSSNARIRVDPDGFLPGFSDPVRGWDQRWDVSDSVGPTTPFLPGRNSSGIWSQGAALQGPLMLNEVERPFVGDGVQNGGWNSLDSLELDLLYKLQMLRQRADGLRPMIANPVLPLPVESLSTEGSLVLDAAAQCSKCLSEMKSKRSRVKKKNARDEQSVIMPRRLPEHDLLLDDQISCQGACGRGYRLVDFLGNIYSMCKDQIGCRFLQKVIEGGSDRDVEMVFIELIDHVVELMVDPFGNYVIQKLLEVCTEEHRMAVVLVVTNQQGELLNICLDSHGTRVVQKLIETIKCREHISMIIIALKPHLLELIYDLNGNHVVQRCLQCLGNEHNKFIYDTATKYCVDIATHQNGCCVLNRCIAYSSGRYREKLVSSICANGVILAQDAYGNYVIQYIIELQIPPAAASLLSQFEGRFANLSMQKFSSHVVEKCLRLIEASHPRIVQDFISFPHFDQLLQDRFANYVIQSALEVIKGSLRSKLVEAIRPYEGLRSSPYCKKIFSRSLLKK